MKLISKKAVVAALAGASMLGLNLAHAASALPPVHRSGQVEYMSGGIGSDESKAIETAGKQWPLTLEFVVTDKPRAEFAADVSVAIRDGKGQDVFRTRSEGPFLMAKLAPGSYHVDAVFAGKPLHKNVVVKPGEATKTVFQWPMGTGESH
jgi:hypothetical protein